MTLAIRVLIGLVAGFLLGLGLAGSASPAAVATIGILTPVGTLFVNLIRVTALPLVVSMIVASVGTMAVPGRLGRTGACAALIAIVLLAVAAAASVLVAGPILAHVRIDQAAALALRASTTAASPGAATPAGASAVARWLVDLVPENVFKAAADGAMLPVRDGRHDARRGAARGETPAARTPGGHVNRPVIIHAAEPLDDAD